MLVRPRRSRHRTSSHSRARARLTVSSVSRAYTRMLVSTNASAAIDFFASGKRFVGIADLYRRLGEKALHGTLIARAILHLLLQQFANEPGDALVLLGGLDAHPLRRIGIESDGDVFHARNITRESCIYDPL